MKLEIWEENKPEKKYFVKLRPIIGGGGIFLIVVDEDGHPIVDGHLLCIKDNEIRPCGSFNPCVAKEIGLDLNEFGAIKIGDVY